MSQISFPYASFEQGVKDAWAKLDGPSGAYRFMVNGYKSTMWRKQANTKRQDKVDRALKLLEEHEAKIGSKADRQLGRI